MAASVPYPAGYVIARPRDTYVIVGRSRASASSAESDSPITSAVHHLSQPRQAVSVQPRPPALLIGPAAVSRRLL